MDHAQAGGRAVRGRRGVRWCAALFLLGVAGATCRAGAEEAAGEEFFEKRVRPILAGTCFRCHGGPKVSGGLRVDSREALLRGGESGPAIDLAAPERSLLLRAVQRSEDVSAMPPDKPLADRQVADLTAWLRAGAPGQPPPRALKAKPIGLSAPCRRRRCRPSAIRPGCEPKQQPRDLIPLLFSPTDLARVQEIDQQLAAADQQLKQLTAEQTERAKKLQEQASAGTEVLAEGNVGEGESTPLTPGARRPLEGIPVKSGDVLRLVVLPRGNHGADSTLVEWTLSESGGTRRWSVADLVSGLTQGNPHADIHGHSQVWCFLDLQNGPQLLPEVVAEVDGRKELQAWRYGSAPSVFVNSARQPVKVWTELPPQSFFVHPGERGPVAVAWISPIDGTVDILHLMGLHHEKLTFRHSGRDYRLTDVKGQVVRGLLS